MSEKCNAFQNRFEESSFNDNDFCYIKFELFNKSKDQLSIIGQVKTGEKDEIIVSPNSSKTLQLLVKRIHEPSVKILNSLISLEWKSFANNRRGNLNNFTFSNEDLEYAKEPTIRFFVSFDKENSFNCCNVGLSSAEALKGLQLYFYPLKITQEGIKLIPHDLILTGCLALPILDLNSVYKLKIILVGTGEFVVVVAVGTKNSISCWSHKQWKLENIE